MVIYTGKKLEDFMENARDLGLNQRFLSADLEAYLSGPNDGKVCCLYGLRRTGKTILMMQELRKLMPKELCMLVECEENRVDGIYDTMSQLRDAIDAHPECHYIFIDEATRIRNFIGTCSILADNYAYSGKKIVMAGKDSIGFMLSRYDELLDRVYMIHTTYIPYKEYHYLLHKDLMDYMRYGGTLTDGSTFYNNDKRNEYTNSAIVYNILHSLERWNQGKEFDSLNSSIEHHDLATFISMVLERNTREFVADIINQEFHSHDLGSFVDLLVKANVGNEELIHTDEMSERVRIFLGIKENPFTKINDKGVETVIFYLKKLDVLYQPDQKKEEYIFTQPGLRYCQAEALLDAIVTSDVFGNYGIVQQEKIKEKIGSGICSGLLEDIIFMHIAKEFESEKNRIHVGKYRNRVGSEADIVVTDIKKEVFTAYEVKLSDAFYPLKQARHLTNGEFIDELENVTGAKIKNRVVIYTGDLDYADNERVVYLNAEDFLLHVRDYIQELSEKEICSILDAQDVSLHVHLPDIIHSISEKQGIPATDLKLEKCIDYYLITDNDNNAYGTVSLDGIICQANETLECVRDDGEAEEVEFVCE